ncbi:unnamed protein product, partial [Ascophyllum nodosum]
HSEDAARVARALNRVLILCSSCVCSSSWARSGSVQHGDIRCCHFHDNMKTGKQSPKQFNSRCRRRRRGTRGGGQTETERLPGV